MTSDEAERLMGGFARWAEAEPSVRALALAGSWARAEARPDSDLDLVLLTNDLGRWTADGGWLSDLLAGLGFSPDQPALEPYGVARSWRVAAGPQVELELTLVDTSWADVTPIDPGTRRVLSGGFRILLDKDVRLSALLTAP